MAARDSHPADRKLSQLRLRHQLDAAMAIAADQRPQRGKQADQIAEGAGMVIFGVRFVCAATNL